MKKGLKVGKSDYLLLFAICCGFIGYAFIFEPDLMPPSLMKLYIRFANMEKNEMILREAWIELAKRKLAFK